MDLKNKIQSLQQSLNVEYTKPDPARVDLMINKLRGSPAWDYLTKERGFTEETIDHFNLGYDTQKKAVSIPHYKEGELINIKYRYLNPKDVRYTSEANAEQWLFNDSAFEVATEKGAVAIAEGEFDCMSLWQAGIKNCISPGSGANSYGTWIETLDKLRAVYIAYDNDEPGQMAGKELADRIGIEKCKNVVYPEGIKDANEFILANTSEEILELFSKAPFMYKSEFSGLGDVIDKIINDPMEYLEVTLLPGVKLERDQLVVLSGDTNAGKSTVTLNMIKELARREIPTLFMPFERGVYSLGRRYLQIALGKTQEGMQFTSRDEWKQHAIELAKQPVYMAVPDKFKLNETIIRAKRLFGVKMIVIDHLDYIIRNVSGNRETAISDTLQGLKRLAEEQGVIIIVVTHVRKLEQGRNKATMDDLKGSSSLKQDPEVVAMLYPTEDRLGITIDILKNKGPMIGRTFNVNNETGVIEGVYDPDNF